MSEQSRFWGKEIDALAVLNPIKFAEYQTLVGQIAIEEERELCEDSLLEFLKHSWTHMGETAELSINWHHEAMIEHLEAIARGELRNLVINIPPRHSKALSVNTPVFTTWGWKRHGDLRPGDFVFGPDGTPKRVLEVTPHTMQASYLITFDDRANLIASGGHLWAVLRDYPYASETWGRVRKQATVTTTELCFQKSVHGKGQSAQRPDAIPLSEPLQLPPRRLLIDPYVLGIWLGDGDSNTAMLTTSEQDLEHFSQFGQVTRELPRPPNAKQRIYRILLGVTPDEERGHRGRSEARLSSKMKDLGLLKNKHIPVDYLEASVEQRWELLRGLMDTDGSCSAGRSGGVCTLSTKYLDLAMDFQLLTRSLGIKSFLREDYAKIKDKIYGPYYWVSFTPPPGAVIFKLVRKQNRVRPELNTRTRNRYIDLVKFVGDRLVNCIQVEGDLYLAGRDLITTHNSLLTNVAFPAWLWAQQKDPEFPLMGPHVRFLSVSFAAHLAERFGLKMLNLVMGEWYQKLWGKRVRIRTDQQSRAAFANYGGGERMSASVEAGLLGRGADIIIADDPHDVEGAESQIQREATVRAFSESLSTRVTDPRIAARVLIMQRLHEDDCCNWALDHWPHATTKHLMFPARFDPNFACEEDPRTSQGQPLWPELWNDEQLAQMEIQIGPYSWAGQYQQIPSPREGGIIEIRDWNVFPEEPPDPSSVRRTADGQIMLELPEVSYVILSLDTAMSEEETSAWNACIVWGVWHRRRNQVSNIVGTERPWFSQRWSSAPLSESDIRQQIIEDDDQPRAIMMEAWRRRCKLNDPSLDRTGRPQGLVQRVIETARRRHADKIIIEDKTRAKDVRDEIIRQMGSEAFQIELWNPQRHGDKVARLHATQPLFSQKLIYAPGNYTVVTGLDGVQRCEVQDELKWVQAVIHEIAQVPRGKWDDLADAASMGLLWLRENGFLELTRQHMERAMRERMWQPNRAGIGQEYGV